MQTLAFCFLPKKKKKKKLIDHRVDFKLFPFGRWGESKWSIHMAYSGFTTCFFTTAATFTVLYYLLRRTV